MKIRQFDPVIYPYKLWVVIAPHPKYLSDIFTEKNDDPIQFTEQEVSLTTAMTLDVRHKEANFYGVVIYFKSKKGITMKNICHESGHAAKFLFEHIGADITPHEPFEYVLGWVAECCEKVKNNKA
jgi:hypothetical protein